MRAPQEQQRRLASSPHRPASQDAPGAQTQRNAQDQAKTAGRITRGMAA
jgi:hypothetical protein